MPLSITLPRRTRLAAISLFLAAGTANAQSSRPSFQQVGPNPRRTMCVEVCEKARGAVVNIHSERTILSNNAFESDFKQANSQRVNGMGTGIVIDPRGYIVTNHHVVDDVQLLRVKLGDGTSLPARVLARDAEADLAVLKIDSPKPLATLPLGTATDLLDGEPVIAIGNAFGYEHTITTGVVSSQKRNVTLNKDISYRNLIQTDASINPGNSGGPLINVHGELVGVNVAIRAGAQGIGFAIPVDQMMTVAADLISLRRRTGLNHGVVLRNQLDATDNPVKRWATVDRIDARFVSSESGLQTGDVIDRVGDTPIRSGLDFERALLDAKANDKFTIAGRRDVDARGNGGAEFQATITVKGIAAAVASTSLADSPWRKMGVKLSPASAELVAKVNPQLHGGMTVTEVGPNTPAAKAGFQRGDVLIGLHQWETINWDNVVFVLNHPDRASFAPLKFFVIRNGALQSGWLGNLD